MCCHKFFSACLKKVTSLNVSMWMKDVKGVISYRAEVVLIDAQEKRQETCWSVAHHHIQHIIIIILVIIFIIMIMIITIIYMRMPVN
jgi:hypothetical protein